MSTIKNRNQNNLYGLPEVQKENVVACEMNIPMHKELLFQQNVDNCFAQTLVIKTKICLKLVLRSFKVGYKMRGAAKHRAGGEA